MRIKLPKVPRDRYIEHHEIIAAHKVAGTFFKVYIPFKLKTSLDQKTIVSITLDDVTDEGIYYRRQKLNRYDTAKKGKLRLILWDEELHDLVDRAMDLYEGERTHLFVILREIHICVRTEPPGHCGHCGEDLKRS